MQDVRLVGIFLAVYQRANSLIKVREEETDVQVLPTGFPLLGRMGNKVRNFLGKNFLRLERYSFCLNCAKNLKSPFCFDVIGEFYCREE